MKNLTKIVGSLSLGALALSGCKSKEAEPEPAAEQTEAGASGGSCSGAAKEGDGKAQSCSGGKEGSCGGGK